MSRAWSSVEYGGAGEPIEYDAVAEGDVDDLLDVGGDRAELRPVREGRGRGRAPGMIAPRSSR